LRKGAVTMAIETISELSKRWGCARNTIYRKIDKGEISTVELPGGGRGIDTSEMLRVFGEPDTKGVTDEQVGASHVTALVTEIQQLHTELEAKDEQWKKLVAAKDEHIETLKQSLKLLESRKDPDVLLKQELELAHMREEMMAEQINTAIGMLGFHGPAPGQMAAPEPEPRKGFWARLLGK
jgi:hypothetical protein